MKLRKIVGEVMISVSIKSVSLVKYSEKYAGFGKSSICKIVMEIRLVNLGWLKKIKIEGCNHMNENIDMGIMEKVSIVV